MTTKSVQEIQNVLDPSVIVEMMEEARDLPLTIADPVPPIDP